MTDKEVMQGLIDALIENARLFGATEAKKGFGCYTKTDAVFERSAYEAIEKHRFALRTALAQPEQYDQTDLGLCKKCGWKAVWPDGCLVCEKQELQSKQEYGCAQCGNKIVTCQRCGKVNPSEIHTCTPKPPMTREQWLDIGLQRGWINRNAFMSQSYTEEE